MDTTLINSIRAVEKSIVSVLKSEDALPWHRLLGVRVAPHMHDKDILQVLPMSGGGHSIVPTWYDGAGKMAAELKKDESFKKFVLVQAGRAMLNAFTQDPCAPLRGNINVAVAVITRQEKMVITVAREFVGSVSVHTAHFDSEGVLEKVEKREIPMHNNLWPSEADEAISLASRIFLIDER